MHTHTNGWRYHGRRCIHRPHQSALFREGLMFGEGAELNLSLYRSADGLSSVGCMFLWRNTESWFCNISREMKLIIYAIDPVFNNRNGLCTRDGWRSVLREGRWVSVSGRWCTGSLDGMDSNVFCGNLSSLSGIYNMLNYGSSSACCRPNSSSCRRWKRELRSPFSSTHRTQALHLSTPFAWTWHQRTTLPVHILPSDGNEIILTRWRKRRSLMMNDRPSAGSQLSTKTGIQKYY